MINDVLLNIIVTISDNSSKEYQLMKYVNKRLLDTYTDLLYNPSIKSYQWSERSYTHPYSLYSIIGNYADEFWMFDHSYDRTSYEMFSNGRIFIKHTYHPIYQGHDLIYVNMFKIEYNGDSFKDKGIVDELIHIIKEKNRELVN